MNPRSWVVPRGLHTARLVGRRKGVFGGQEKRGATEMR